MLFGLSSHIGVGLTSILTQDVGIFLRQNRVRMCALWLSNSCTNPAREKNDNPSVTAAPCHLPLHKGGLMYKAYCFLFPMWGNIKSFVWFRCFEKKRKYVFAKPRLPDVNGCGSIFSAPLCKGSCQRSRLRDCRFANKPLIYHTPPVESFARKLRC